jgi:hypothetical protein
MMWVKPSIDPGRTLVGYSGGLTNRNFEIIHNNRDILSLHLSDGNAYDVLVSELPINISSWNFIAVRYEASGDVYLRVNDEAVKMTSQVTLAMESKTMYLGSLDAARYSVYGGLIDHVYIYPEALSEDEIDTFYAAGVLAGLMKE